MKLTLRAITLVSLLLGAAATASADSVPLNLVNAGTNVMGGVYVGPYNFTTTGNVPLQLVCDDFADSVQPPESWTANTSTFPSLTNVKFTPVNLMRYQEVAWLTQQIFAHLGNAQTVGDIQWALWDVFDPGISNNDPYGTISAADQCRINGNGCSNPNNWLQMAINNASSGNYSGVTIYTPVTGTQIPAGNGPPQEYIGVPEPGTLLLMGTGLFGLVVFRRRYSN